MTSEHKFPHLWVWFSFVKLCIKKTKRHFQAFTIITSHINLEMTICLLISQALEFFQK